MTLPDANESLDTDDLTLSVTTRELQLSDSLPRGMQVAAYIIDRLAFQGGFASLYCAHHKDTGAPAAVKVLHRSLSTSERVLRRFAREATTINKLAHPNIVAILDVGELPDGRPCIIMEWIEGRNLTQELARRGPFSARELLAVMTELCAAVTAAHEAGVIHRDIKTHNVMVVPDGAWFTLKLVDFGIAKLTDPEHPGGQFTSQTIVGTLSSMAPEQILGEPVDARTDIYAMAIVAYRLATGQLPFRGGTPIELEEMHLHVTPPRASDMSSFPMAFDQVIRRAMSKDKQRRHSSAQEFLADLRACLSDNTLTTGSDSDSDSDNDIDGRRQSGAAIPGVAILVEVRVLDDTGDGDALDESIERVIELAVDLTEQAGLWPVIETNNTFAAAALLDDHNRDARASLIEVAMQIEDGVREQLDLTIDVLICVHAADTEVSRIGDRMVPSGGDLLRLGTWPHASNSLPTMPGEVRVLVSERIAVDMDSTLETRVISRVRGGVFELTSS